MPTTILLVDDSDEVVRSLSRNFERMGYACLVANNPAEANELFLNNSVQLVILDVRLGEENGLDLLAQLLSLRKNVPVVMLTAFAAIEDAVRSIKLGAFDYIQKPIRFEKLLDIVQKALHNRRTTATTPGDEIHEHTQPVVVDPRMAALYKQAKKIAATDLPILIYGESGTGKELIADFIHSSSRRASQPFLKINCAAFPESLLDNELFGHDPGAFTDAKGLFRGVFERADHSSLFLDELADMPAAIQAKILRVIQNKEIHRIGGKETIRVDVRFIAASNRDLDLLVKEKKFREDLFYRLNAAVLRVPPLQERTDEIPALVRTFLQEFAAENSSPPQTVDAATIRSLAAYEWPGNVRELKNAVFYAASVSEKRVLQPEDLPPHIRSDQEPPRKLRTREMMERTLIIEAITDARGNKTKAAETLGMSRTTLYNKMVKYGIQE